MAARLCARHFRAKTEQKMSILHLTDLLVQRLKTPGTYHDDTTRGFGLRIGKRSKTWFVIRGAIERRRTTIGRYPDCTLAAARKQALVLLGSPVVKTQPTR